MIGGKHRPMLLAGAALLNLALSGFFSGLQMTDMSWYHLGLASLFLTLLYFEPKLPEE